MLHTIHIKANILCIYIDFYIEHLHNYVMHTGNHASQAPMLIINLFAQNIAMKEQQCTDGKEENFGNIILESQNHFCLNVTFWKCLISNVNNPL